MQLERATEEVLQSREAAGRPSVRPSLYTWGDQGWSAVSKFLSAKDRQTLKLYWAYLPEFNPAIPNPRVDDPNRPFHPQLEQLDGSGALKLDWSGVKGIQSDHDQWQPVRWEFCPCVLRGHKCGYTGVGPSACPFFHDICAHYVSLSPQFYRFWANSMIEVRLSGKLHASARWDSL